MTLCCATTDFRSPRRVDSLLGARLENDYRVNHEVTHLLREWQAGDESATSDLWPILHAELRQLARHYMGAQPANHTLQATALVNEAFLKLVDIEFRGETRKEFFALASRAMRSIIVDHARKKSRVKRGADAIQVTLSDIVSHDASAEEIVRVDELLTRLTDIDPRMSRIVELKVFGGLTYDEIAALLELSSATIRADMRFAVAWLKREMSEHFD